MLMWLYYVYGRGKQTRGSVALELRCLGIYAAPVLVVVVAEEEEVEAVAVAVAVAVVVVVVAVVEVVIL